MDSINRNNILTVGITGTMGSGKSYCSDIFGQLGAICYNTDNASKAVQVKVPELRDILISRFGPKYYIGTQVNKEFAKRLFFSDSDESRYNLKWVTDTVAPYVVVNFNKFRDSIAPGNYVLVESAILFETGFDKLCDLIICVKSPNPVMATYNRDYTTKEEWQIRMSTQLPDNAKHYDYIIGNDYSANVEKLVQQVHEDIMSKI